MTTIILVSLAGAVIYAVVGTLWYSNATPMGKWHMQYLGFDKLSEEEQKEKMEEAKPMMAKLYGAQMALSLLTSFATVFIVTMSIQNGVPFSMAIGFPIMNWLCFMVPAIGSGMIWGSDDRKLARKRFVSDSLSNLTSILLIALLASLFA